MAELNNYISNITVGVSIFLAGICLLLFNKFGKEMLPFLLYIIIAGSFELVTAVFASIQRNNLIFIHLFTLLEFVFLNVFFSNIYKYLGSKFDTRKLLFLVSIFVILNSILIQGLNSFNSISSTICSLIILGYCVYTFLLLVDKPIQGIYASLKWIVIGIFIYHTISLTILALGNVLVTITSEYKPMIWMIRAFIMLLTKFLFGFILLKMYLKNDQNLVNARA